MGAEFRQETPWGRRQRAMALGPQSSPEPRREDGEGEERGEEPFPHIPWSRSFAWAAISLQPARLVALSSPEYWDWYRATAARQAAAVAAHMAKWATKRGDVRARAARRTRSGNPAVSWDAACSRS